MAGGNIYIAQHSFATGEVSPDIANRSDLDKYRSALLMARNCVIRPYGGVAKRSGSLYLGEVKKHSQKVRLIEFKGNSATMLEVGVKYIRIWNNGSYTGKEITTPFSNINNLHFNQSADTMFICSSTEPVYILQRQGSNWIFEKYAFTVPPFEDMNDDINHKLSVNSEGNRIYSSKGFFTSNMVGMVIKLTHRIPATVQQGTGTITWVKQGSWGINKKETGYMSMGLGTYGDDTDIEWKIVTHGEWRGKVQIWNKNLTDNSDFEIYRTYTGNKDYNVTETGTISRNSELKVTSEISDGEVKIDFTVKPYTKSGMVVIKKYISATECEVETLKDVGKTSGTSEWQISSWGGSYGYPRMSTFFQDRFILAGSSGFPYKVWMSRTGDYPNFDIEKVDGTLTDDSSISVSLISRSAFNITHIVSAQDLILLTDGNEWIIDGSEAIKPSRVLPRSQTQHGAADCTPQYIGNRLVYVQRRSSTVRDMGYTYESDNYNGVDLTLLAKHLVHNKTLIDSTYCQEPDSILYYVRNDGVLLSLTLIKEQDIYAWAQYTTSGYFESVCSLPNGNEDSLYVVVRRIINGQTKRYIERIESPKDSKNMDDYVLMDCMRRLSNTTSTTINVPHLAGCKVQIVADGKRLPDRIIAANGNLMLPGTYSKVSVGLLLDMRITLPQIAMDLKDGTLQGRTVKINSIILRLRNSRGGKIGVTYNRGMDMIGDASIINEIYTGDVNVPMPAQGKGFATDASVCILHNEPYPFNLLSLVRDVTIGGGAIGRYNNNPL